MLKFTYQVTAILATGATRMEVSFFGTVSNIQNTKSYIFLILTIVMMIEFEKLTFSTLIFFYPVKPQTDKICKLYRSSMILIL